jgi:ABC-2 type transport system permease protein
MSRLTRALPTLLRVSAADHFAYRAEMTIWILTATLPLVMLALWNAVVGEGAIAGFGQPEMARYFAATLVCRQLTGAWVFWELAFQIRTGRLSGALLRPIHPLVMHAVWMLTALPYRILILSPILVALAWWRPDVFRWPGAAGFAMFVVSISLAWTLAFLIQCLFGILAFWLDKADGLFNAWFALWMVGSGYLAPLAVFPAPLRTVLELLPFRATLAVPVELLGGFLAPADAWRAIGLQAAWAVALWGLVVITWRRGLVRYGAFGA